MGKDKRFLLITLIAISIVFIFYIFLDTKPNALILMILGLSVIYLLVQFIRKIFLSEENGR